MRRITVSRCFALTRPGTGVGNTFVQWIRRGPSRLLWVVSHGENSRMAQYLLGRLGGGAEPDQVASLFSPEVRVEISGDAAALPWVGIRTGRLAASEFIRDMRRAVEQVRFEVHDVLVSERRAVIIGEVEKRIRATGRVVESPFPPVARR